jgi:hypothetical protein
VGRIGGVLRGGFRGEWEEGGKVGSEGGGSWLDWRSECHCIDSVSEFMGVDWL